MMDRSKERGMSHKIYTPGDIRGLRKMRGWTLKDLAERSGLAISTICEAERGFRCGPRAQEGLRRAFEGGRPLRRVKSGPALGPDRLAESDELNKRLKAKLERMRGGSSELRQEAAQLGALDRGVTY